MLFTSIPQTSLQTSVLCLGTAGFGSDTSVDESFAMLDAFVEAGGNIADTAHIYAAWLPNGWGQSERTLGQWLRSRRPQNFVVSTKGGHPPLESMEVSRLSAENIAHDLQESLDRLQLDSIDLYWMHRDDPAVPALEVIQALNQQLQTGRIRAIGASNWSVARVQEANLQAKQHGMTGFCASQVGWSLAQVNAAVRGAANTIQMDDETLRWHRQSGFAQIAYSSQANGFFATPLPKADAEMTPKQKKLAPSYLNEENRARYKRAEELAAELGRTTNEVALSYIWSQSFPGVAIMGPRNLLQLTDSLRAADVRLTPQQIQFLEGQQVSTS
ncbi:MAG TPA: aldo/keto reductase [Abditibacteriaceae bacterium]|jgi:aryl-alcohol dehydrogenase-like predicted oxidoreductase